MNQNFGIIHIAVASDIAYQQHLGVMLCSLFENNSSAQIIIHLILNFDENGDTLKLRKLVESYNQQLCIYQIQEDWGNDFQIHGHVSSSTYFRLLIPSLLPVKVNKVLYLDSDMLILCNIDELWSTDLEDKAFAAVIEPGCHRHEVLNIPSNMPYFNAGVILMNLTIWRNEKLADVAIQFAVQNPDKMEFWDQDALNATLFDRWKILSANWNQTTAFWENKIKDSVSPAIVHFTGSGKPWQPHSHHIMKNEYFRYLRLTPWKNFRLSEETYFHYLKQNIKKALNFLYGYKKFQIYNQ